MPIPDFQTFFNPLSAVAADRGEHSLREAREKIAAVFNLSEEDLSEYLPGGAQTKFDNIKITPSKQNKSAHVNAQPEENHFETPEEILQKAYQNIRSDLAGEILSRIKSHSPSFSEKLVADLMAAMGYGCSRADAGRSVGQRGDEGIGGRVLANYMIDFNLGTSTAVNYEIKRVDPNCFVEEYEGVG